MNVNSLRVNEVFYSLQGEGARAGEASIFIRLSGCDLTCGFCDTEFESGKEFSVEELLAAIRVYPCHWIVWTGGEPALQLNETIVDFFHQHNYKQAIETNGGHAVPKNLDFITVSPKVAEHIVARHFSHVTELKYVRHAGQPDVPRPSVTADYYWLSPLNDGQHINLVNLKHCISLCLQHPQWRLSVQQHKQWKVL